MTDKKWEKFLQWLYKAHQVNKTWIPNRVSIELWEEYKKK